MGYKRKYVRITPVGGGCGRLEIREACRNQTPVVEKRFMTRDEAHRFLFADNSRLNREEGKKYNIVN